MSYSKWGRLGHPQALTRRHSVDNRERSQHSPSLSWLTAMISLFSKTYSNTDVQYAHTHASHTHTQHTSFCRSVRLCTSVATMRAELEMAQRLNSVRYSSSVCPGHNFPGTGIRHP